jgi:hypothetical protein
MTHLRRPVMWVGGLAIVVAGAVAGSYAAVAASGGPSGAQPPQRLVAGKWIPDQTVPHGDNGTSRSPQPAIPGRAAPTPGPYNDQVLTAAQVHALGIPLPFPGQLMALTTAYFGIRGNDDFSLYTGVSSAEPGDAMIVVFDEPADNAAPPYSRGGQLTVNGLGALTIKSVTGDNATILDASGHAHVFNLQTHAFSS